jgi:hypothetical protein
LAPNTVDSVQPPWPSQRDDVASFGHLLGASTRVDGQVTVDCRGPIICRREVILSPPRWGPKPSWDAPPQPPQPSVAPPGHYYGGLHSNYQLEICSKAGRMVLGCNCFSIVDPQVTTGDFLCVAHHMKLAEVTILELLLLRAARGRLRWDALPRAKRLGCFASPIFKPCMLPRKSRWCHPQPVRRHAHHSVSPSRSFIVVFWSLHMS